VRPAACYYAKRGTQHVDETILSTQDASLREFLEPFCSWAGKVFLLPIEALTERPRRVVAFLCISKGQFIPASIAANFLALLQAMLDSALCHRRWMLS